MIFFSYTVLFKQNYVLNEIPATEEMAFYSSSNGTLSVSFFHDAQTIKTIKMPVIEIYLLIWILSITFEELRQVTSFASSSSNWKNALHAYFSDFWNLLDAIGCSLFMVGFILKMIAYSTNNDEILIHARYIFYLNFSFIY